MTIEQFINSTLNRECPQTEWSACLQALWWSKKGNWEKAHNIAQDDSTPSGSWIHAYLHRVEGDQGNAAYWYARAGKPIQTVKDLDEEWVDITLAFLKN
ncbi:MAG: hypothetical protein P8N49_01905 [Opitutales bacterium]|nr:hypothetical protein [Opitutales bacterium]